MTAAAGNFVEVRDLHFAYGDNRVLRGLSLDVPRGKVVGILGTSGCGKSTLLKLIGGQLRPARGTIHVDGKTGLSGAGRTASDAALYAVAQESVRPYRVPGHQHTPEMERGIELASGFTPAVVFVPHLVPAVRGVVTTAYGSLAPGATTESLTSCLLETYAGRAFVRVLPPGEMADSKRTRGSNVVELQAVADARTGTAVVIGALDNLVKGAAGQAIQNFNLVHELNETAGLTSLAVYP